MSVGHRPRVTIEPADPTTDADAFLAEIVDTLCNGGSIDRDGVVLSLDTPAGLGAYTDEPEAFEQAADAAASDDSPQDDPEAPDCHHDPVWTESGVCMRCQGAVGASLAVAERSELGADAGGGRL